MTGLHKMRDHWTMKEAQAECRRLRRYSDAASHQRAAEIEAQWKDHPDYESDYASVMGAQAGNRGHIR